MSSGTRPDPGLESAKKIGFVPCLAFAVGLWLLSQTLLGISLWWTRRPSRSASLPRLS